MSRCCSIFVLVLALGVATGSAAHAAIYVSWGADGSAMYTDAPTKADYKPLPAFGLPPSADVFHGQYADLIQRIASEYSVDPALVRAIIRVESNFQPAAVSRKGAQGLMQLMPATADRFAVANAFDPAENIRGGVRYLRTLLDMFPGQLTLALAAYNAGENAVTRFKGVPPYPETRDYVNRVLKHLAGGGASGSGATALASQAASAQAAAPRATIYKTVDADGTPRYSNVPPLVRPHSR
jgi:soluble lytic murein transglycosylase